MTLLIITLCIALWFGLRSVERGLRGIADELHRLDAELQRLDEAADRPAPPGPRLRLIK